MPNFGLGCNVYRWGYMKKYFVAKDGIQKGPWTLDEITQNIQKKNLSWNDYIYDEKIETWLFLFEFSALTDIFNSQLSSTMKKVQTSGELDIYKDRVWYILKSNQNYGPFTKLEMVHMLQSKTLFEYDFIWKGGQNSWARLSEVDEFKPEQIKEIYKIASQDKSLGENIFYRRKYLRAGYACELLIHNKQKVYSAVSIEVSAGGAGFSLKDVDFAIGTQLYLHFKPGNDVPAFNATCTVVSKHNEKYGVSFNSISTLVKDQIEKFTKKAA